MSDFNISTYVQIMQNGLTEYDKQEKAGRFLLESIAKQDNVLVDISGKMVSNLVKRKNEIHDAIKEASAKPEVIVKAVEYFNKKVVPRLNPHTGNDCCENIIRMMERDANVPQKKREEFYDMYHSGDIGKFLAMTMMYALSRPNKAEEEPVKDTDFYFLSETDNICPICGIQLVQPSKNGPIKKYKIIQIFPENVDNETANEFEKIKPRPKDYNAIQNRIALCWDCANEYEAFPNVEDYKKICEVKEQLIKRYNLKKSMNDIDIEEQIIDVLSAIAGIKSNTALKQLSLDALRLDEKIEANNFMLKQSLEFRVLSYYHFIEDQFSQMERDGMLSFNLIGSEVNHCYEKLESGGLSQEEICEQLSRWFMSKTGLRESYKTACDTIVAFFVQNCEVFHEIS